MVGHRFAVHRLLLVESGSTVIEGLAATAVVFLLLVVMVQGAFLLTARHAAETAVAGSARRAARADADLAEEQRRLQDALAATVTGARLIDVDVERSGATTRATAEIEWDPPGPQLIPIQIRVSATSATVAPP